MRGIKLSQIGDAALCWSEDESLDCCTIVHSMREQYGCMPMSAPFLFCTVIQRVDDGGRLHVQHPVLHIQESVQVSSQVATSCRWS